MSDGEQKWAARAFFAIGFGMAQVMSWGPPFGFAIWQVFVLAEIPMVAILLMYFPHKDRAARVFKAVFTKDPDQ